MKIILANGTELNPLIVTGAHNYVQGANRDTLTFVFPATESLASLDEAFSESACESITIFSNDGHSSIYKDYAIRVKLEKTSIEVSPATPESEAVIEERINVQMAQRTYTEKQLASLVETVDVLVMESLMA